MNTPTRNALLSTVAALSLLAAPAIAQDGPARGNVQLEGSIRLLPNGDGVAKIQIRFSAADYTRVKGENPNAFRYVRDFSGTRSDVEITDTSARYEDAKSSVILEMTQRGAMRNLGGGRWVLPFARGIDFINLANEAEGTVGYFVESGTWPGGIAYKGKVLYHLPKGAKEARFDNSERTLTYTLEREAKAGPAALGQKLRTKDRLMSALYKVYGLGTDFAAMWVAKSTFKNSGSSVIKDLRVRFRLSGYSDWSLWQSFAELVPDQTVVAPYYPVLEAKIATLTSNTPANLLVEWRAPTTPDRSRPAATAVAWWCSATARSCSPTSRVTSRSAPGTRRTPTRRSSPPGCRATTRSSPSSPRWPTAAPAGSAPPTTTRTA
ncbi:MAG: hypothetical protein H6837_06355 [Planctomycetes bacterium]|nr:hypothetical protein [Planctomycetota bacterium]